VDGAIGLWALASPRHRSQLAGAERADSWTTDAHKWLNVPYDCGMAFVADAEAHRTAMSVTASYIESAVGHGGRDPLDYNPEFSRRARGIPVYAALRSLGVDGVAELVDGCCDCAARFAEKFAAADGVDVLASDLNQVLIRFGDDDLLTDTVLSRVYRDGTCLMSGTTWHGRRCMRISVSSWRTTLQDVDTSVEAVLAAR
jgi:glutamate/tyrosine decarboxylase-like PLP-dependent enzyme